MGYYARGDYYRGDYYMRGDFFGALGGVLKKGIGVVAKGVGAAVSMSPGVQILKGAAKAVGTIPHFGGPPGMPGQGLMPGSTGGPSGTLRVGAGPIVPPGGIMRGYHLNKSKLAPSRTHGAVPAHTILVKNRHMNVANPRALARASRRAHGFLKLASKFVRYYHPKKRAGRAYIGRRRKSR